MAFYLTFGGTYNHSWSQSLQVTMIGGFNILFESNFTLLDPYSGHLIASVYTDHFV